MPLLCVAGTVLGMTVPSDTIAPDDVAPDARDALTAQVAHLELASLFGDLAEGQRRHFLCPLRAQRAEVVSGQRGFVDDRVRQAAAAELARLVDRGDVVDHQARPAPPLARQRAE